MTDNLSPEDRRKTMRAVKGKATTPERRLAAMLAGMRLHGWRKNAKDVIGHPDIVFDQVHLAIFIDGCFWHGCPICNRKLPETNRDYWQRKITRNVALAAMYDEQLKNAGWTVVRIWEHQFRDRTTIKTIQSSIRHIVEHSNE